MDKLLVVFGLLIVLSIEVKSEENSSSFHHFLSPLEKLNSLNKLANNVCEIIATREEFFITIGWVAIVKFRIKSTEKLEYDTLIDEVQKCMPKNVSTLVYDLKQGVTGLSEQKPSLVIFLTLELEMVC